jgi:hypothetical protein
LHLSLDPLPHLEDLDVAEVAAQGPQGGELGEVHGCAHAASPSGVLSTGSVPASTWTATLP